MDDETQANTGVQAPAAEDIQADTAQSQESSADVQVTNEAPEAAQDVKDPVVTATDTAEERLYAGKYKSVEDLEKSYESLQSKATRDAQEKAELTRILNESFAAPAEETSDDDFETPDPVAQRVAALERQTTVSNFVFTHQDANPEAMKDILTNDPVAASIPDHNARLEYAYYKSKSANTQQVVEEARRQAVTDTQAKVVEKQAAQVESGGVQAQPAGKEELSKDQLRDALRSPLAFDEYVKKHMPGAAKMRSQL